MAVIMVFDGAVDLSSTFVIRVDDKGGPHVHGAVYDKVNVNV